MSTVDLWPETINLDNVPESPTVFLKKQASLLGKKTNNLVEASVETASGPAGASVFKDTFVVLSNVMGYRHELFFVTYPLEFFPASIYWSGFKAQEGKSLGVRKIASQEVLERALAEIFAHDSTVRMIQALMSRSRK